MSAERTPGPEGSGATRPGTPAGPLVYKFGGTSLADAERIRHVAALVAAEPRPLVVVVSALAGTTDALVRIAGALRRGEGASGDVARLEARHRAVASQLAGADAVGEHGGLGETIDRVLARVGATDPAATDPGAFEDRIRAVGEDLCAPLVAHAIRRAGREAQAVDARSLVLTDASFGRAAADERELRARASEHLGPLLEAGVVPVVQGFVGATADGRTTTLGRGGSDYTATLLGAALDAAEVHIWTDVDGVLSGDPRTVAGPRILDELGFEEAVELAHFGAKVLHPAAAKHAVSRGLTVRIRNSFAPERAGTLVLRERRGPAELAAVAFKPDVALIQVRSHPQAMPFGFLARVFEILARHRVPVDLVATSHTSTAFTLDQDADVTALAEELRTFADVDVHVGLATVTVVGHGLLAEPGVNAAVLRAVARTPIRLVSQASDVSLSMVVDGAEAPDLVRRLHAGVIGPRRARGPDAEAPPTSPSAVPGTDTPPASR